MSVTNQFSNNLSSGGLMQVVAPDEEMRKFYQPTHSNYIQTFNCSSNNIITHRTIHGDTFILKYIMIPKYINFADIDSLEFSHNYIFIIGFLIPFFFIRLQFKSECFLEQCVVLSIFYIEYKNIFNLMGIMYFFSLSDTLTISTIYNPSFLELSFLKLFINKQ